MHLKSLSLVFIVLYNFPIYPSFFPFLTIFTSIYFLFSITYSSFCFLIFNNFYPLDNFKYFYVLQFSFKIVIYEQEIYKSRSLLLYKAEKRFASNQDGFIFQSKIRNRLLSIQLKSAIYKIISYNTIDLTTYDKL